MAKDNKKSGRIYTIRWVLHILIICSGLYQVFFGEMGIGILTLIAAVFIVTPSIYTRGAIRQFPIEIEILLFIMVLLQFVLGEARDFYTNVPYYDKFVHYLLPMFLGIIGFLIFYTLHETGKLSTTMFAMMLIIVLVTLGIGALWEIFEYLSDVLIYPYIPNWHHFQGNAQQDALTDTMTDLIYDTLGAIFGAFIGLWYMKRVENPRAKELIQEFDAMTAEKRNKHKSTQHK